MPSRPDFRTTNCAHRTVHAVTGTTRGTAVTEGSRDPRHKRNAVRHKTPAPAVTPATCEKNPKFSNYAHCTIAGSQPGARDGATHDLQRLDLRRSDRVRALAEQAEQCVRNIGGVLAEAGCTLADVTPPATSCPTATIPVLLTGPAPPLRRNPPSRNHPHLRPRRPQHEDRDRSRSPPADQLTRTSPGVVGSSNPNRPRQPVKWPAWSPPAPRSVRPGSSARSARHRGRIRH
jgi:hypothetical protein